MARNSNGNNSGKNNQYGNENYRRENGERSNQFYQGDRDEGHPRSQNRQQHASINFRDEEHLRNANERNAHETYGGRSERNSPQRNAPQRNDRGYRPSGDWNGNYDDGTYTSSFEATEGRGRTNNRDTRAQTHGHTAYGSGAYGSGRYETDYDPRNSSRQGGYERSERPEYNRFDQDHDNHGYTREGRSWRAGEGLEPDRPHGRLYGSTQGETDHGRSRFRSADEDWHLPTPPHDDDLERYNNRYGQRQSRQDQYGSGGRGYSTRNENPRNENRGSNTTGAGYGRNYRGNRSRDDDDVESGGVD